MRVLRREGHTPKLITMYWSLMLMETMGALDKVCIPKALNTWDGKWLRGVLLGDFINLKDFRVFSARGSANYGPCMGQIQPQPVHTMSCCLYTPWAAACTHHELLPVHNIFKWLKKIFNISWHIKIIRNSSISVHKVLLECSHANSLLSMAAFSMHWQRWKGWQGPRWPAKLKTFTTSSFTESLLISVLGHKIKSFLNGSQLSTLVHAY